MDKFYQEYKAVQSQLSNIRDNSNIFVPFIVKQEGGLTYLPSVYTLSTSFSNVVITEVFKHKITHNSFKIIYKSFQSRFYFCIQNQKFPMIAGHQNFKVISKLTSDVLGGSTYYLPFPPSTFSFPVSTGFPARTDSTTVQF